MITVKVAEYYDGNKGGIPCAVALLFLVLAGFIVVNLSRFSIPLVMGQLLILILVLVLISYVLRNPPGALQILIGAGLLVPFSIPLFIELTATQPVFPANFPEEVLSLPVVNDDRVRTDAPTQFMIIHERNIPIELRIDFERLSSWDGLWAYNSASVTSEGALNGFYDANPTSNKVKNWDASKLFRSGISTQEFAPALQVSLPIAEEHLYQWITIRAKMDVLFPSFSDDDLFVDITQNLTRQFEVFIGITVKTAR